MRVQRRATIVVIEAGASWPKWLDPSRSGDMVVVVQSPEGQSGPLIGQTANRLAQLEDVGWVLDKIVLVANAWCEVEAISARSILGRGLIALLKSGGGTELVLSSDHPGGGSVHQGLLTLAAALDEGGVHVLVRVGSGEPVYGSQPGQPAGAAV